MDDEEGTHAIDALGRGNNDDLDAINEGTKNVADDLVNEYNKEHAPFGSPWRRDLSYVVGIVTKTSEDGDSDNVLHGPNDAIAALMCP